MRRRCGVALGLLFALAGPLAAGEKEPEAALMEKPLTAPLGNDLLLAARGAARLGVKHLKALQGKNPEAVWLLPLPSASHVIIGYKTVQVKRPVYKTVTVMVPTYKVSYRWVWVTEKDPKDPYAPVGRKRIQEPVYEVVGQHPEQRSVPDGDKTQMVDEQHPIYQETEPLKVFPRWSEGVNALALYALLASGEPPDSEAVKLPGIWLYECTLDQHGIPDTTYELSLFLMVFSRLDRERYGKLADQMVEKLVRGQIDDGPCRGLWGTYSVDVERLKDLQMREAKGVVLRDKVAADLVQYKAELAAAAYKREQARATAKIERAQQVLEQIGEELKKLRGKFIGVSREFVRGEDCTRPRRSERVGGDIRCFPGALYDGRFAQRADITTTHFALVALREAARRGYVRPETPLGKELGAALARTANALKALQQPDGSWGYCVQEQGKPIVAPKEAKPQEKPNEPCMSMTAAGLACFSIIAELGGRAQVQASFGGIMDKARAAALTHLELYSKPGTKPPVPVDTQFSSLYYYFALATALDDPMLSEAALGAIPEGVLCRLLFSQENDGAWPAAPAWSFGSSVYLRSRLHPSWIHSTYEATFDHKLVNTCFAVLLLCEAARPTLGGQWHVSGERNLAADLELDDIRNSLAKDCKAWLRWRSISGELPDGLAAFVPALVVTGNADPKGRLGETKEKLRKYVDDGGMLIVQSHAATGTAFEDAVRGLLRDWYADAEFRPLPEDHAAFKYARGLRKLPAPDAAWRGERLVAVFLRERPGVAEGPSKGDIKDLTRNLLAARAKTAELLPDCVVGPKEWAKVEKDIEAAIARIKEQHIEMPDEEPDPKKPPEKVTEPPKKPPEPPKKPDEPKKEPPKEKTIEDELREFMEPQPEPPKKENPPKKDEKF